MGEFLGKEKMGDTTEGSSIAAQSAQDDPTAAIPNNAKRVAGMGTMFPCAAAETQTTGGCRDLFFFLSFPSCSAPRGWPWHCLAAPTCSCGGTRGRAPPRSARHAAEHAVAARWQARRWERHSRKRAGRGIRGCRLLGFQCIPYIYIPRAGGCDRSDARGPAVPH